MAGHALGLQKACDLAGNVQRIDFVATDHEDAVQLDAGTLGQLGGQTALAHAADAADERALGPVVGQGAAQLAQFALAPHKMARQGQAVDVDQGVGGQNIRVVETKPRLVGIHQHHLLAR